MRVSELYEGPVRGQDVCIIGLGPSLRVFPKNFFDHKFCILLKDAWKLLPNAGPVAFSNNVVYLDEDSPNPLPYQIVKCRHKGAQNPERTDNHVPWDSPRFYCFSYREQPWDLVSHHDEKTLWQEPDFYWNYPGGNVAIFAIQFAVLAGARSISLVGCDCGELLNMEYVSPEISENREKGKALFDKRNGRRAGTRKVTKPKRDRHDYVGYLNGMQIIRKRALRDYGVPVVSVVPFMGLFEYEEQFRLMLKEERK